MRYDGQVVWITGASSGIGASLAEAFAAAGASVILSGRRAGVLRDVAARLKTAALVLPFEATDSTELPAVVAQATRWRGRIDMLVNNAGISQRSLALDTSPDVYRRIMEVDFFAPLTLTQLVLPDMVARGDGHIIVVGSIAGEFGAPLRTAYCAAKHALMGWCDALRGEVEQAYGVRVTSVLPGSVRTQIAVNALTGNGTPYGRSDPAIEAGFEPDLVARRVLTGLAAGEPKIVVAEGIEATALEMRRLDPPALFALVAREGVRLAELREAARAARGRAAAPPPAEAKTAVPVVRRVSR